jgi:hypothetical protein
LTAARSHIILAIASRRGAGLATVAAASQPLSTALGKDNAMPTTYDTGRHALDNPVDHIEELAASLPQMRGVDLHVSSEDGAIELEVEGFRAVVSEERALQLVCQLVLACGGVEAVQARLRRGLP